MLGFKRKERSFKKNYNTCCSFIFNLKSPQIRDHIIDVERHSQKMLAKDIFKINSLPASRGHVVINEFLHAETHKLVKLTKVKAQNIKYKYSWEYKSTFFYKQG